MRKKKPGTERALMCPAIQNYDNAHNGLLVVTYDEGQYSSTNHIVTIERADGNERRLHASRQSFIQFREERHGRRCDLDLPHVQFGTGCGWMHVYVNSGTVYSPSTWRPAVNDSITVYGSGSCSTGSVTAAEVVKL
jgi:hypothetical protein